MLEFRLVIINNVKNFYHKSIFTSKRHKNFTDNLPKKKQKFREQLKV